jgi:4-hydroxy-tetrahydrodipicolinate synthase
MMAQVYNAYQVGDLDRARDIFDAYMPMIRYEAQPGMGLAIRKYSLAQQGIIAHPTQRQPASPLTQAAIAEVNALADRQAARLQDLGL